MIVQDNTQPGRLRLERDLGSGLNAAGYQIRVSHETEDPDWDAFLARTRGGHYMQTSLWSQVRAVGGWRAVRVVVRQGDHIVAGAQLLIRPLPLLGAISNAPRGPLVAGDDPMLTKLVISALRQVARTQHIQYLLVQPPCTGEVLAQQLPTWGFHPSSNKNVLPKATVRLDLTPDLDTLLAQMHSSTRRNIRLGQRRGITVREGTERDLPTFYRLLMATSKRQNFLMHSEDHYTRAWHVFGQHGLVKLFLAEYEGEVVSGLFLILFGDTVIYWKGGWSGQHGNLHPNNVLHWTAITWAKAQSYHYYDFGAIEDPKIAGAMVSGEGLPEPTKRTIDTFKLGFGAQVTLFPEVYDYIYNPLLRWTYTTVFPKIENWSPVVKVKRAVRGVRRS
jgi:peptidoglycan pentaglycine glycine transferase (the first glycine)